jgi:hypothetical protein
LPAPRPPAVEVTVENKLFEPFEPPCEIPPAPPAPIVTVKFVDKAQVKALSVAPPPPVVPTEVL